MKKEITEKEVQVITKRLDAIERRILTRQFIQNLLDSIRDIGICAYCHKAISTEGKLNGCKISWWRKGAYQCGDDGGRLANWCSKKCEAKYLSKQKLLNAGR